MKSFVGSLIFLLIVVTLVLINSWYCSKICSELIDALVEFPDRASGNKTEWMTTTQETFTQHSQYFGYVLPKTELIDLSCDFSDIFSYFNSGDTPSYRASLERAKRRIRSIKSGEEISFKEIFGS